VVSDEHASPEGAGPAPVVPDAAKHAEERADQKAVGLEGTRQTTLERRRAMLHLLQRQGLLVVLIGLIITFWASSPYFMSTGNWGVIAQISAVLGILAVSQTLLVVSGGIDISVGSAVGCSSALIAYLVLHHVTAVEAGAIVLAAGAGVGLINGTIIVKLGVNPLVTTLGMYSMLFGLSFVIIGPESVSVSSGVFRFLASSVNFIPVAFVIFVVMLIIGILVARQTALGRHIYAIGDQEEAAARAGINTQRVRLLLFVFSGFIAAFAGVLTTAQLSSGSAQVGGTYLLSVVTAVVLGGTRLSGGRGGLFGTFIAVMILGVLQNGFALLQVNSYLQNVVLGFLLILAVLVDQTASRLERR
jgi:ribose/xylose/arabinose/galactoside ABC-type transport system permease subunit